MSAADPRLRLVRELLGNPLAGEVAAGSPLAPPAPVSMGAAFGESYLAVEILADRLREVKHPEGRRLVVVGYGADDDETRSRMTEDWLRLARHAAEGFEFESVRVVVADDLSGPGHDEKLRKFSTSLSQAVQGTQNPVVVPFHLGPKYDGMMGFTAELGRLLPPDTELLRDEVTPHPDVTTWLRREANRHIPLSPQEVGVVILAHGADFHWNETMRQAGLPLAERYPIEFAFCMADARIVERAVRKLERRGVRAIVVARVFALESSFREEVERMLGLDVESSSRAQPLADHDHGTHGPPAPRIRSEATFSTVGGLEADPLFAKALVERARDLSRDPGRETLILVGHGAGDDRRNEHWLGVLESLAREMRANGGASFRAIRVATWREDWPEKRREWIEKVRQLVEEATRDGGRAIVIPARTNGQGREREFLAGLTFELGEGFAPHPLFARWLEQEIGEGTSALRDGLRPQRHASWRPISSPIENREESIR